MDTRHVFQLTAVRAFLRAVGMLCGSREGIA
jgi:hypothetical protein